MDVFKRRMGALLGALVILLCVSQGRGQSRDNVREVLAERSERFVETVMRGHLSSVRGELTPGARRALTEEAMRQLFGRLTREGGGFREVGRATTVGRPDGSLVAAVPVHFERLSLAAQVIYEREGPLAKVAEFSVVPLQVGSRPATPTPVADGFPEAPPHYADGRLFRRQSDSLRVGDCEVPVALFLPATAGGRAPAPAMLLVQPIPLDRRAESSGMTRDMMEGLATRGVAVAAYRESDCIQPQAVLEWLLDRPEVDRDHVTLVGYRTWGSVASDIAASTRTLCTVLISVPDEVPSEEALLTPTVFFYPRAAFAWGRDYPDHGLAIRRVYPGTDSHLRKLGDGVNGLYVVEEFIADLAAFARTGQMRP